MGYDDFSVNVSNVINGVWRSFNSYINRLSSGQRINSASDGGANLAIREVIRGDIAEARQGSRNINDAISMLQTADGAASAIGGNLIRMQELAAQASGGVLSEDQKQIIQQEYEQLAQENQWIADTTMFNGQKLFGSGNLMLVSTGQGANIRVLVEASGCPTTSLQSAPLSAVQNLLVSLKEITTFRGQLGASINQLETENDALAVKIENQMAAESRISDTDVAKEAANMMGSRIQAEAATATVAQSGLMHEAVLNLLGG